MEINNMPEEGCYTMYGGLFSGYRKISKRLSEE